MCGVCVCAVCVIVAPVSILSITPINAHMTRINELYSARKQAAKTQEQGEKTRRAQARPHYLEMRSTARSLTPKP
jgi:hypothetical protein